MRSLRLVLFCIAAAAVAQQPVTTIRIDASQTNGPFEPVWNYFGYDEPNYTYTEHGRKLIRELAEASFTPIHIRTHNLLTTGNGTAALKWGSTNAYTETPSGAPVYDWTIVDRILDTYMQAGVKPFVEIGFMPKALSSHPEPYQHTFPKGQIFTGWAYPPNNYGKWSELVYQWVRHSVAKYGEREVASWDWEVWNEPDIGYWQGTPEEYDKLYDYTADAVKRAMPAARVGGPASTGPANPHAAAFLQQFLEHCDSGKNYATQGAGAPLDFITFHAKGHPESLENHVQMGISQQMKDVSKGFEIVNSFSKFRSIPIILSESDPEGCAACAGPQNAYRNGTLYPTYVAAATKTILEIAQRERVNLRGIVTWAFEFEDRPYFHGYRSLATNGIDKPVMNVFRMLGLMQGDLVKAESDGAVSVNAILANGVREKPDVDALVSRSSRLLSILIWNYDDNATSNSVATVRLHAAGLPADAKRILLSHFRIDQQHSNSYALWLAAGSRQALAPEQRIQLEEAGQLQLLESPKWLDASSDGLDVECSLPSEAVSLIQLRW